MNVMMYLSNSAGQNLFARFFDFAACEAVSDALAMIDVWTVCIVGVPV